jgi:hypothetical protein
MNRAQRRSAERKITRAMKRGWRPGLGPPCSFGQKRRARREAGEQ